MHQTIYYNDNANIRTAASLYTFLLLVGDNNEKKQKDKDNNTRVITTIQLTGRTTSSLYTLLS